jgi:Family of unknown function (DUF6879)
MKTNILFNIGHVVAGTIVGYLVYHFSGEHDFTIGLLSIVTGLLTIILLEVIFQPYTERKEFNELASRVNYLTEKVSDRLTQTADLAGILKYGNMRVPLGKVTDVWLERIWQTRHRYWGVLYAAPKEVTITTVFNLGLAVMAAKVRVDQVDVKRVFLLEGKEELESSRDAMRACVEYGLQVRYLFREQMRMHTLLAERASHLSSLDFTIFDSHIVWLIMLDKNRHITGGELMFDEKMNQHYSEVFRLMWDAGSSLSS